MMLCVNSSGKKDQTRPQTFPSGQPIRKSSKSQVYLKQLKNLLYGSCLLQVSDGNFTVCITWTTLREDVCVQSFAVFRQQTLKKSCTSAAGGQNYPPRAVRYTHLRRSWILQNDPSRLVSLSKETNDNLSEGGVRDALILCILAICIRR